MYRLIRRIIILETPLKSHRFLSSSSENVSYPKSDEKPVIVFFEKYGFSKSQISVIVKKLPQLLSAKPEKTLLPKLLFLQSKGISSPEVAKLVSSFPYILTRSLNERIIPNFHYFQDLLQSEEKTIAVVKRFLGLLHVDLRGFVRPNMEVLRQIGVPHTNIIAILRFQPRLFSIKPSRFKERVEEVKIMGLDPLRYTFVLAVGALLSMNKSTWKKKVEVYRKWGCPEEEILSAFGRHPVCMISSEDKINGVMDYFVNTIGCETSFITRNPSLIAYSLKRRIVPRGYVYLVLSSEGLIKRNVNLRFFNISENSFLDKFIKPHEKHIPGLLKLYEEKLEVSESKEV